MGRTLSTAALIAAAVLSSSAQGAVIKYELTDLGGNQFRYDYTLTNDGSITPTIALFDISFDPALYDESSLTNVSTAPGWDILFLASGIGVPAAFDAFATGPGVGLGESVGGFAVSFGWLGVGAPEAQMFQVYDSSSFALLGEGTSGVAPPSASVPEPTTLALIGLGLLGFVLRRRGISA